MNEALSRKKDEEISDYLLEQFLNLSRALTGFDRVDLLGTGMAEPYYREITRIYKEPVIRLLFEAKAIFEVYGEHHPAFEDQIRQRIIEDIEFAQIAKNIIQLWYLGSYTNYNDPAPLIFKAAYIISPEAYQNGLLWPNMGSHPAGAKQPGFGSWNLEPQTVKQD
ncbi:MAG: hypothetical protein H7Y30_13615 [Pyrinomonadaceae bacterium]|nr:hypothetical protein [Pyrinomonadaceae bacterium]